MQYFAMYYIPSPAARFRVGFVHYSEVRTRGALVLFEDTRPSWSHLNKWKVYVFIAFAFLYILFHYWFLTSEFPQCRFNKALLYHILS